MFWNTCKKIALYLDYNRGLMASLGFQILGADSQDGNQEAKAQNCS